VEVQPDRCERVLSATPSQGNDVELSTWERHSAGLVPIPRSGGSAELSSGTLLADKYRIDRPLGYWGGLGRVYLGSQERVGRQVAVKVLRRRLVTHRDSVSQFIDITLRLGGLGHPNLVSVYDFGDAPDGGLYMAMEYLEGVTLQAVLSHAGRLDWRAAVDVVRQAASAMAAAHQMGVAHRDLKPTNIFVNHTAAYGDMVKVLDFALANLLGRSHQGRKRGQSASVCGTPEYMAPETSLHGHYDARSDIYALGCVFHQMVAGRLPYHTQNAVETAMLHQVAPVPQLEHGLAPAPIADLIRRMMSKRPDDRPRDGSALLVSLRAAEEELLRYENMPTQGLAGGPLSFLETEAWATHFDPDPPSIESLPGQDEPHPCEAGPTYVFEPDLLDALRADRLARDAVPEPVVRRPTPAVGMAAPSPGVMPVPHPSAVPVAPSPAAPMQPAGYRGPVHVQPPPLRPPPQRYTQPQPGMSPTVAVALVAVLMFGIGTLVALAALAVLVFR
jgi:serine/threonine protein kinase